MQTAEFMYLILLLVLVASALLTRRIPVGKSIKMLIGWAIIFTGAFALFALRDTISGVARQVVDERKAESTGMRVGNELRIRQALDGHFWVDGQLNDENVRFLIDSGATTTSISRGTAERVGIELDGLAPAMVQTANGVLEVERGRVKRLRVGHIERTDLAVHVSDAFGDMNVLGMNFLSTLSGWRVEGDSLIMTP
jgi:aspartyl protease family protein